MQDVVKYYKEFYFLQLNGFFPQSPDHLNLSSKKILFVEFRDCIARCTGLPDRSFRILRPNLIPYCSIIVFIHLIFFL